MLTLHTDRDEISRDMFVTQHFCFPEVGVAVALRPGDVLIFNPQHPHCVSMKENIYKSEDAFLTSLYLKTNVVAGNNNSDPFSEREGELSIIL